MNNPSSFLDLHKEIMSLNKNYLQKKIERSDKKEYSKSKNKKVKRQEKENTDSNNDRIKSHHQLKINDFFEYRNLDSIPYNTGNNNDEINYLYNINDSNIYNGQYTIYYNRNKSKSIRNDKTGKINDPFKTFSEMVKQKQFKERFNILIEKGIFTQEEISQVFVLTEEYNKEINSVLLQDSDKLVKLANYLLNKGFNEKIRFILYKCLINYGIPNVEKFNNFYNLINHEITRNKLKAPEKMCILLYIEYIDYFIKNDYNENSLAKNKFISEFFFNREKCSIVKSNFNFINVVKNNPANIDNILKLYIDFNFDDIFKDASLKINMDFPKAKDVIIKIITNIVIECDRNGFLKYKKVIGDSNIIFNGLKIKGKNPRYKNWDQLISFKLFGMKLSEKKLRNIILEYFLLLASNFYN